MSNADTLRRIFSLMDEKDVSTIRELIAPEFSAVLGGNPPKCLQSDASSCPSDLYRDEWWPICGPTVGACIVANDHVRIRPSRVAS